MSKTCYLLLAVLFISGTVRSQQSVDSAEYYYNLVIATDYNNLDSMATLIDRYRSIIDTTDLTANSTYYSLLGVYYQRTSAYEDALVAQRRSLELAEAATDSFRITKAYQRLGVIYKFMGDFDNAVEYFTKAKQVAYAIDEYRTGATSDVTISQTYTYMGQYQKALENIGPVIIEARERKNKDVLYSALIELGNAQMMTGQLDECLDSYIEATRIMEDIGEQDGAVAILGNIGGAYFFKGEYQKAMDYYRKGIELGQQLGDKISTATSTMNLGEALYTVGRYDEAKDTLLSTLQVYKSLGSKNHIVYNYDYLFQLEYKRNRMKDAVEYLKLKEAYKDSMLNEQTLAKINELEIQFETEQKEKELANKNLEVQTQKATIAAQRNQLIMSISGAGFLLLFGWIAYSRSRNKHQQAMQQALLLEKERGFRSVIAATEEERKRISKDLHDGIGQQLTALRLALVNIQKNAKDNYSTELAKITDAFTKSAEEVRSISHRMMPKALLEKGLVEATEDLLQDSFKYAGIDYLFEHSNMDRRFDEKVEISVYRILQELVNNVIKHAEATQVNVQLIFVASKIMLLVEDNGKGMTTGKEAGHGLLNIKSRLDMINGEVHYDSSPASGTVATVNVPIEE